jgi:hypothetical protein
MDEPLVSHVEMGPPIFCRVDGGPHPPTRSLVACLTRQEWPATTRSRSEPVRVKCSGLFELQRNHQVLAYGYDLVGIALTLHLCDPNRPRDDHVTLS